MAGDWIKIEHSLPRKPEVMQLASILGIDEMAVVGHLVLFWSWVDQNLSPECPATTGTTSGLDRVVGRDGFATAMGQVGWLRFVDGKIEIPNYDHHLSESAKKRSLELRKKRRQRETKSKTVPGSVPQVSRKCPDTDGTITGLEKREERIEIENKTPIVPKDIVDFWNVTMGAKCELTKERTKHIKERLKDSGWFEKFQSAVKQIPSNPFLRGENDRGWKADLDFMVRPDSVQKIHEGKYSDGKPATKASVSEEIPITDERHPEYWFNQSRQHTREAMLFHAEQKRIREEKKRQEAVKDDSPS